MTKLLLIRHGSTVWNAEGRYQGQTDIPLSERGRDQAERLSERLRREEVDAILSSDLKRAWETAEVIASHHRLTLRPEPRLREINFGEWEGKTHEDIEAQDSELLRRWFSDPVHASPPSGETLRDVVTRVSAAYEDIKETASDETVVIVAHGGTLRVLLCLALEVSPEAYWQFSFDPASLSVVDMYDEGAILNTLNDTAHLQPAGHQKPRHRHHASASRSRKGKLTLILGGARSGKSDFAQRMVREMSDDHGSPPSPTLFVATAEAGDEDMTRRIENHRRGRPAHWHTLEAQRGVGKAILERTTDESFRAILVDCMTMLASNVLMDADDGPRESAETELMSEVEGLIDCAARVTSPMVIVSNEVGSGVVPASPLGRTYRDLLGRANQALAQAADEVILVTAGVPRVIKSEL